LGFLPPELIVDALELSRHVSIVEFKRQNSYLKNFPFIQSSDAHYIEDVGSVYTIIPMQNRSFQMIKMALRNL